MKQEIAIVYSGEIGFVLHFLQKDFLVIKEQIFTFLIKEQVDIIILKQFLSAETYFYIFYSRISFN